MPRRDSRSRSYGRGPPPRGGRSPLPPRRMSSRSPPRGARGVAGGRRNSRSPPRRCSRSPPRRSSRSPPRRSNRSPPRRGGSSPARGGRGGGNNSRAQRSPSPRDPPPRSGAGGRPRSPSPPPRKARSPSRSPVGRKSSDRQQESSRAGDQAGGDHGAEGDPELSTKVVDGAPNRAGDPTWLAEVYVPRPLPMRPGTICVRGPLRFDQKTAEEDAARLVEGHKRGGYKEVQEVRNALRVEAR
mmetsp:Transcript_59203/g.159563  ORF Transcript_59203/g.159563 Transcript_59203/m.159563 type:complete len:242 (-) Transcript_59203:87-812(-)